MASGQGSGVSKTGLRSEEHEHGFPFTIAGRANTFRDERIVSMRIVARTLVLLSAVIFASMFSARAQSALQTRTSSGVVEGKEMGPVHAFL